MVKAEKNPEGYRATEAGILPIDWQVKRLSEIATELTERAGQDMYETVSISAGILKKYRPPQLRRSVLSNVIHNEGRK